ncbi:MAG TPA: quinolinate synthase NadA [Candidatus Onthovicinus excrementipullorum]|nr:quinolinate synthase NadA [Candidatus Onthovicinus excrementipullorum]
MHTVIDQINALKKEQGAVILAHTYQSPEIQKTADFVGDSYAMAVYASKLTGYQKAIVCGVRFMAETVKLLAPELEVVLPEPSAGCPMAEQIAPERVRAFKAEHPDIAVAAYVNTTAALKAECDVCVTSSSALKIIRALPQEKILFIPDQNLGAYVRDMVPEKEILLWDGYCPIHSRITEEDVLRARAEHPDAAVAMHPECRPEALRHADVIGSTKEIIDFMKAADRPVIVATERNVYDKLAPELPDKVFYQLCPEKLVCADMKKVTPELVLRALSGGGERMEPTPEVAAGARRALDNMLKYGG